MLIPSVYDLTISGFASLSRRVNANSQLYPSIMRDEFKLIKKGEC